MFYFECKDNVVWLDEDIGLMWYSLNVVFELVGVGCNVVDWVMEGSDR